MKTPWRFVADLVSRKPKADMPTERPVNRSQAIALEYHHPAPEDAAQVDATPAEQASETPREERGDADPADARPDTAPAMEAALPSSVNEDPVVAVVKTESEKAPAAEEKKTPAAATVGRSMSAAETATKARAQRPSTRRKKDELVVQQAASVQALNDIGPSTVPVTPKSFVEEMADLDAEVSLLRRQLIEKLTEQNAQLRKMLTRYAR